MLEQYKKAFKAYDIRGIYGTELDANFFFYMWYGLGKHLRETKGEEATILLGTDARKINTECIDAYICWLTNAWIKNIDYIHTGDFDGYPYSIVSTSVSYYIWQNDRDMTTIFTASHNPASYTGLKIFNKHAVLTETEKLRTYFQYAYTEREEIKIPESKSYKQQPEKVQKKIIAYYIRMNDKRTTLQKNHKFVVDFCHGSGVACEKHFWEQYANNHYITMINDYPDGTFPAHESDTSEPHNFVQLVKIVKDTWSEFGVMLDGDADRIAFVTNTGQIIPGDIIYAIIVKHILQSIKSNEKPICIFDCMTSKTVEETIKQYWWIPQRYKVGRFFIHREMSRVWAILGGEVSGHYMFKEFWYVENVLLTQYYVMKELENYNNFDEMVQQYKKYYKWPIQSISVSDKDIVMKKIADTFAEYNPTTLDGISVYTDEYRFNVRQSNTENKIRFTVEADDEKKREATVKKIHTLITEE